MVILDVAASDGLARKAVLMGTLAPEVGNMTALRALNLAGNDFSVRRAQGFRVSAPSPCASIQAGRDRDPSPPTLATHKFGSPGPGRPVGLETIPTQTRREDLTLCLSRSLTMRKMMRAACQVGRKCEAGPSPVSSGTIMSADVCTIAADRRRYLHE